MSPQTEVFSYDAVSYDTEANPDAHPGALQTAARLFGLAAPPPSTASVLELGCGNGEHAIAAAAWLPSARLEGVDLAGAAIAEGTGAAKACGLENVTLSRRDVVELADDPALGEHDYVVAHGLYSWVPPAVREATLRVAARALKAEGVLFVSCNALPGWELSRALRAVMRRAARGAPSAAESVTRALDAVRAVAATTSGGLAGAIAAHAGAYLEHVARATPPDAELSRYVFHDLLAECNDPFSAHELAAHAAAHGLTFLTSLPLPRDLLRADAPPSPSRSAAAAARVDAAAAELARYGTPFLQAAFCRAESAPLAVAASASAAQDLFLHAALTLTPAGRVRTAGGVEIAPAPGGRDPLARAVAHAHGFVRVRDLTDGDEALALDVVRAAREGLVTLRAEPPRCAARAPSRPRACAHTRARAADALARGASSAVVVSALHAPYRVARGELTLAALFDGTRERAELAGEAARQLRALPRHAWPDALAGDLGEPSVARWVDAVVDKWLRHALLEAP